MQKLQDSVFTIVKTSNLSPAVFSFLQPSDDFGDKTPLGGILNDTKYGWLALGPKFCVVDLRTGLKVAARTFGSSQSNNTTVTCVVELPKPLTDNSQQLIISLQCEDIGLICVLHINGSQILRCMQTDVVVTELAICDRIPDGPFTCFDGLVMAGTKRGEIFVFDLNRASLIQALKDISQGYEHLIQNEANPSNLSFLPLNAVQRIEEQRELAIENDHHLAMLLNENSMVDGQYIFRNPDGTVRMKAQRDLIRVTVLEYIPQLGSMAVGFNFGGFQIWNLITLDLEFTSQVNVECLPVTHFGFQEPCDDPRAFCYLWVVFSAIDRYEEEKFPLAVMYSLTYQGKRMLSDTKCLYQDFSTASIRFQIELGTLDEAPLLGGKCISCHSYSIKSTLGDEGEDSMLNICQLVWECWGEDSNSPMQYGMLLFDLDQWYKDQMPAKYRLESSPFMSSSWCSELSARGSVMLHSRLSPGTVCAYTHATRLEEHFYPNSLQYDCICLNTSEALTLRTVGIQRQIVAALEEAGGAALLHPGRLHEAASRAGLVPQTCLTTTEDQRRYLLSVALEARLSRFLKRCAHDWATGSHSGVGCTLPFLVDWAWKRAIELKENAKELTAPLFTSSALPDRNVVRCLEHCVQQLTQLTDLMDAILTKCCNLVVPDALSEMEERHVGIGCVSLYFQVVQWLLRVGLLPERGDGYHALPYPASHLRDTYNKRRIKLNRLQDNSEENDGNKSCSLLYIDQLIEHEFGGDRIHQMWIKGGSEDGLYPPPSLYSLLRVYLLPEIAEEHKHSLVLYLLVDYSRIYDDIRNEEVIRRLMQFPTMFGLSNTAIKATQAFWHLDHRDFDFALDQLQCLTGNTLHEWQHKVVLSSLLAQKKTQAALQYLHVRKPAPIQNIKDGDAMTNYSHRLNDHDKLEDWQSCCNLYLSRGLVCAALDVVRMCVLNVTGQNDKARVLGLFYKGCRNTGNLSKILQVTLTPFEEEVFIKYLENCNESQTSDLLIMYYLQQARYLEAERYNNKLKQLKPQRVKEVSTSTESLLELLDRESARDALVEVVCDALPQITSTVAHCALDWDDIHCHVKAPKPMSVFLQAKSPKNTFTYKSSFIQDTIGNASETWMNKPKMRKGMKRALDIEETPFICTPKLLRTRSVFTEQLQSESSPPKRARLNLTGTPKTPKMSASFRMSEKLSTQMEELLDMPEVQSPAANYQERAETPHSILKIRRNEREEAPSPVDSRYLGESDDELLETASNHTHYSDTTNKHLRFTIPTASESGSTPSPLPVATKEPSADTDMGLMFSREKETEVSTDSFVTSTSNAVNDSHVFGSPPKKLAMEYNVQRRSYKDTVRARPSLSLSANSSLLDDPSVSIESIADIPITLINPRYSGERRSSSRDDSVEEDIGHGFQRNLEQPSYTIADYEAKDRVLHMPVQDMESDRKTARLDVPLPRGRKGIRSVGESTPVENRSRAGSVERVESPIATSQSAGRILSADRVLHIASQEEKIVEDKMTDTLEGPKTPCGRKGIKFMGRESTPLANRSRSKTPELSPRSSPLPSIPKQPKHEVESEPHDKTHTLSVPRQIRNRSKTPERMDIGVESTKLAVITESPTKSSNSDSSSTSPSRRSLRSRSRTPEIEIISEPVKPSPRNLRRRSKTPEKMASPKKEHSVRTKKSLSRIVLEANTFAKTKQTLETLETEITESRSETIECTPTKTPKQVPNLMNVTLSPIVHESVLPSSVDTTPSESTDENEKSNIITSELGVNPLPAFTTIHETYVEKSVLRSYESSVADSSIEEDKEKDKDKSIDSSVLKPLPAFTTINETDYNKSVLHSYESSDAETLHSFGQEEKGAKPLPKPFAAFVSMIETDFERSVLKSHGSSVAESPNTSKEVQNTSSLITNDSEIESSTAEQKEKEKIVEIQREINEIEGDMSNDSQRESDRTISSIESDESTSMGTSSTEDESLSDEIPEDDNGVISIRDSDDSTSAEDNLAEVDINIEEVPNKPPVSEDPVDKPVSSEMETDPLNQGQVSIMTDDNSGQELDKSICLSYSLGDFDLFMEKQDVEQSKKSEAPKELEKILDDILDEPDVKSDDSKPTSDSKDVVDTMISENAAKYKSQSLPQTSKNSEHKDAKEIVSKSEKIEEKANAKLDTKKLSKVEEKIAHKTDKIETEVVKPKTVEAMEVIKQVDVKQSSNTQPFSKIEDKAEVKKDKDPTEEETPQAAQMDVEKEKPTSSTRKRIKSISSEKAKINEPETITKNLEKDEPKTPVTRKRANSNASVKFKDTETTKKESVNVQETDEASTPKTRKRSQSNASKLEEKTPEETASRRRAKTPTSAEVRKIITRRVSREMEGKLDESDQSLDSSVSLTPKRRSTRSRSKNFDDNESVASESSIISNKSIQSGDVKVRKGRKAVTTKPDLSVIPEVIAEESTKEDLSNIIAKYAGTRRLTRKQTAMLGSLLHPAPSQSSRGRHTSTASRASRSSVNSEPAEEEVPPFDVQPIDRISLLNKTDFEGPPDVEELLVNMSPESIASEATNMRRSRLGRAASEVKQVPRAAKINRRTLSVDVVTEASELGSPGPSGLDSPARGRRASFQRACEALHTPKGRKTSTDVRSSDGSIDSPTMSEYEAPSTPSRRARRGSIGASQAKSDTGKRSKKMPALEEENK